jgi:hypothetical protein
MCALGWVNCQLVDDTGTLRSGTLGFKLWPNEEANPIGAPSRRGFDPTLTGGAQARAWRT